MEAQAKQEKYRQYAAQVLAQNAGDPKSGETRTLERIKYKGDVRFRDHTAGKDCIISKKDKDRAKELYKVGDKGPFVFVQAQSDKLLQYRLP